MGDRSAGHCGRHRNYRCHECETNHPDDYHGDGKEEKVMTDNKFTDEEVCQGLDLQAERIDQLEQAIKRIGEHYQLFEQEMGAVYIPDSTLGLRVGNKFAELEIAIADAAKMVGEV